MTVQPNRFFQLSLIFLVALNLVPHFNDYTVPTLAVGGLCLAWRLLYEFQKVPLPNFFTKLGLVVALTYLVYLNYGQLLGLEAGSALLICAVSLKLIDRVEYRDAMVLLFLNFMLLLARFFESQTLGITIFGAFDLVITTALLVQLHKGAKLKFDFLTLLKTGGKLSLQIAPFMILLFFVFPRFSTSLVNNERGGRSKSGFSEDMEPGAVSSLAQEEQMAFRVRFFSDNIPSMPERYWRGGTLSYSLGMKWTKGEEQKKALEPQPSSLTNAIKQEIMLEPTFNNWLFALDSPVWVELNDESLQSTTYRDQGNVLRLARKPNKKIVYDVYSVENPKQSLSINERNRYLQVGLTKDPRVLKLIETIKESSKSNEQTALRLMMFYQKQFRYTLSPGKLTTLELGEFLFETRVGFCEHFAVSFASLMRLAEIPSRVVVGFHGGERNQLSDYFMLTSRDAHAWTEIWSDEKQRWLRFDPTVMVSPLRFELGGTLFHSLNEEQLAEYEESSDFLSRYNTGWFKRASLAYDAVATSWNRFLLSYDKTGQKDFFARFGIENVNQNRLLTFSLLILLLYFLWVRLRNKKNEVKVSKAQVAYLEVRKRLAKKGIEKTLNEGPSNFLIRCQKEFPEKKEEIEQFRTAYLQAYYGETPVDYNFKSDPKTIK